MLAVVRVSGKQFVVEAGKKLKIDSKLESKGKKVKLSEVLLIVSNKEVKIGQPLVGGASIDAEIIEEKKSDKVSVIKHHPKKRFRRNKGHRQDLTILNVVKINETE